MQAVDLSAERVGLLTSDISATVDFSGFEASSQFGYAESYEGGSLVRVVSPLDSAAKAGHTPPKRKAIVGFGPGSRRSMLKFFGQLNQKALMKRGKPIFITLTYPAVWPENWEEWKRDLDNFLHWLFYSNDRGRMSVVWRLELQERGAPHFHLIVFGRRFIAHEKVAMAWNRLVAPGDMDHLQAGTQTKAIHAWRQTMYYVSKYMAKIPEGEGLPGMGRFWGVRKPERLDIVKRITKLTREDFKRLRLQMVEHLKREGVKLGVYSLIPLSGLSVFVSGEAFQGWLGALRIAPF